ncbi:MAG: aminotransferase class V-fold PLP-dependent enzyme [Planctomycetia bacterium]|nr:aminotransferase class V-fold PLP-dependent enzyme [Planctomycetia bacterium]
MIYFDNNATTAVDPEVLKVMLPYFTEKYWNASSLYEPATELAQDLQKARQTTARVLGAALPSEILFTSCATESNNAALFGVARANPGRRHIITTKVEHPAILEVVKELMRQGYEVSWLNVDRNGNLDLGQYVRALRPGGTLLVSVMHANNETGVVFPIERLARIAKETDPKIVFHTDATQTVTKLPINLTGNFRNVDLLSFSGHKIHAPKGVGALFVRQGTPVRTFLLGGHQEKGRRGGTENIPYIIGLAKAMELGEAAGEEERTRVAALRDRLQAGLAERIPWLEINGKDADRTPNTLNVACHSVEGESIIMMLSEAGVYASSGSACTSGSLDPSHVLVAMGVPSGALQGNVRFSLSRYSTDEEVSTVLDVFPRVIDQLRRLSPFWDKVNQKPAE